MFRLARGPEYCGSQQQTTVDVAFHSLTNNLAAVIRTGLVDPYLHRAVGSDRTNDMYCDMRYGSVVDPQTGVVSSALIPVLKSRTMTQVVSDVNTETEVLPLDNPRVVTRAKLIRCLKLDELWQIEQLCSGDIHLVGPRVNESYLEHTKKSVKPTLFFRYVDMLNMPHMKPGIFGPSQGKLLGRDDRNPDIVAEGVEADLEYYGTSRHNMVGDIGQTTRNLQKMGIVTAERVGHALGKSLLRVGHVIAAKEA